ncbi:hypothetical protein QJS10_CPB18g00422 [Acorus calamus]|uniref:LysM domain-containing protein n=1 Tax=Acorus calamus TaxID=4465 RepID=A0AAV9CL68_ACOCL|nr:hypothetical protein QJS10_CPB18g00422 [Acorus calamus]
MSPSNRFLVLLIACLLVFGVSAEGARRLSDGGGGRCNEIYVVKEGETLQTISVKCDTIMILDDNPQIQDTDDIGPGTVLLIRP